MPLKKKMKLTHFQLEGHAPLLGWVNCEAGKVWSRNIELSKNGFFVGIGMPIYGH